MESHIFLKRGEIIGDFAFGIFYPDFNVDISTACYCQMGNSDI